jgi:hypothetical protein
MHRSLQINLIVAERLIDFASVKLLSVEIFQSIITNFVNIITIEISI